jgi:hypothetical protein
VSSTLLHSLTDSFIADALNKQFRFWDELNQIMGQQTCAKPPVIRESTDTLVPDLLAQSNPPANSQDNDRDVESDESVASSGATVRLVARARRDTLQKVDLCFNQRLIFYLSNLESHVLSLQLAILGGWTRSYPRATNSASKFSKNG